jgi:hypothetical protein
MNKQFPDRWIGRGGPHYWPLRSPDFAPKYFHENHGVWTESKQKRGTTYISDAARRVDLQFQIFVAP